MNCNECGNPVDLKAGDEITTNMGEKVQLAPGEEPTLCRACMSTGWSEASATDFGNDPQLRVGILSPVQRHDL